MPTERLHVLWPEDMKTDVSVDSFLVGWNIQSEFVVVAAILPVSKVSFASLESMNLAYRFWTCPNVKCR
jgi:hypothetical protein